MWLKRNVKNSFQNIYKKDFPENWRENNDFFPSIFHYWNMQFFWELPIYPFFFSKILIEIIREKTLFWRKTPLDEEKNLGGKRRGGVEKILYTVTFLCLFKKKSKYRTKKHFYKFFLAHYNGLHIDYFYFRFIRHLTWFEYSFFKKNTLFFFRLLRKQHCANFRKKKRRKSSASKFYKKLEQVNRVPVKRFFPKSCLKITMRGLVYQCTRELRKKKL